MKNDVLKNLSDFANKLDEKLLTKEADVLTSSMVKIAGMDDHEVSMAKNELSTAMRAIEGLMEALPDGETNLPAWWQNKLSRACTMIDGLADYFLSEKQVTASEKKKNVKLNKPFRTPGGPKKFSVYVKNEKGNIVKVNFGDPNLSIKRDQPSRRKNFRARHHCETPGPKTKARYWSCRMWEAGKSVTDITKGK